MNKILVYQIVRHHITSAVWSSILLFSFLLPSPTLAAGGLLDEVDKGSLSIGGRAMYFDPRGGTGNWFGGVQIRAHLLPAFAVEGSADYRTNDFASANRTDWFPAQVSGLLYLFPGKRLSPYAVGGVGWYYAHVARENAPDSTTVQFGPHVGGGLQFMVTDRLSIDGSYRFVWLDKQSPQENALFGNQFGDDGHMVTAGFNIHF